MIPSPRGMLDSAGDFFYKRRLTNRRGVVRAAPCFSRPGDAQVAQLVEQRTENPRVGGSIPPLGTISTRLSMDWMTEVSAVEAVIGRGLAPDAGFSGDPATPSEASLFNRALPTVERQSRGVPRPSPVSTRRNIYPTSSSRMAAR